MADFLRFLGAIGVGLVVFFAAKDDIPAALGIIAFFIAISAGWSEARFERLAKLVTESRYREQL